MKNIRFCNTCGCSVSKYLSQCWHCWHKKNPQHRTKSYSCSCGIDIGQHEDPDECQHVSYTKRLDNEHYWELEHHVTLLHEFEPIEWDRFSQKQAEIVLTKLIDDSLAQHNKAQFSVLMAQLKQVRETETYGNQI